jgi:ATP-dependent DNA ligase
MTTTVEPIPFFPTLYTYNHNHKVYQWKIEICPSDTGFCIITTHGEKDGKMVVHSKDITAGKVKRTALEQSIQDAKRKWENKKTKELYTEELPDTVCKIAVRPMLANTFSFDVYKNTKSRAFRIQLPAFVQRKYDGIRCISYMKDGNVVLESRKGIAFQNFAKLKSELSRLFQSLPPDFYFDGELYTNQFDFETISGLIRLHEKKAKPEDIALIDQIEYHIYDFYDANQPGLPYHHRRTNLSAILKKHLNVNADSMCKEVETIQVNTLDDIQSLHNQFVQSGYEGIMIRDVEGQYEPNRRSKYLQKFKEFMEEEFPIIGFHEGTGDEKGAIIWDCKTPDNKLFAVRPKGTFESRHKLFLEGSQYIGKNITVIFQEYSAEGIPRFPVGKGIRDIY